MNRCQIRARKTFKHLIFLAINTSTTVLCIGIEQIGKLFNIADFHAERLIVNNIPITTQTPTYNSAYSLNTDILETS